MKNLRNAVLLSALPRSFQVSAIARLILASAILFTGRSIPATAATFSFTSSQDFFDNIDIAPRFTETFDGLPANTIISPGTALNGITYQTFNGVTAGRIDDNFSRFGSGSLAAEADGNLATPDFFKGGQGFSVSFNRPVYAVGIFFNANPTNSNSDFYIQTSVGTAATGGDSSNYDTGTFFFAGLVSDTPFTTATFGSRSADATYTVDNLTYTTASTAVPEPATVLGTLAGTGFIAVKSRRKNSKQIGK